MDFQLLDFAQQQRQIAVGNPMIAPLHPRVAALFLQQKRSRDDHFEDHTRRYIHNNNTRQGYQHDQPNSSHTFTHGRAVTNSQADILFRLPPGVFYRDAFPASVLRRAPKVNGATNCCRWQISGICIDNCERKDAHVQLTGENKKAFAKFFNEAIRDISPAIRNSNPQH